jgi:spore germination protein GerM
MVNYRKLIIAILVLTAFSLIAYTISKPKQQIKKYQVSVYFVKQVSATKNQVIPIARNFKSDKVKTAISELLKGPSDIEKDMGFFTEIPKKTKLIGIKKFPDKIEINLSDDFGSGGGSESMKLRLKQLSCTAIDAADRKPVYLYLNSKKAEFIGGEGLEIPQPLVKDTNK